MYFVIGESKPKSKKLFASLIQWFEGVDHSHIFVSWKDKLGLRWVAEAKGSGIRLLSNDHFKKETLVVNVYRYELDEAGLERLIKYVWLSAATKYGFKSIYGLCEMRLMNKIYRILGKKQRAKNRFADGDYSQVCCEFAINAAKIVYGNLVYTNGNTENYGLIETRSFNLTFGQKQPRELIDKINGVVNGNIS